MNTAQAVIVSQQDFSWGVLTINTDRSIYQPGNLAYLQMGVINDFGHTVCNADLVLDITDPAGGVYHFASADHTINQSGLCTGDSYVTVPDYSAYFNIPDILGTYTMSLTGTTINGTHTIVSNFSVDNHPTFDVIRTGPTRIFPADAYPVSAKITSETNWNGTVVEKVPSSFTINTASFSSVPYSSITTSGDTTSISWNVSLSAGTQTTIGYYFNAPTKSPDYFLLGPLSFYDSGVSPTTGTSTFSEFRQWQIANDALCTATASGTWSGGAAVWTDCGHTPTTSDQVIINSGVVVTMATTTAVLGTVTINGTLDATSLSCGGGTVSCNLNGSTLTIGSSGTFKAGSGSTHTFNGTSGTILTLTSGGIFNAGTSTVVTDGNTATFTANGGTGTFTGSNSFYNYSCTGSGSTTCNQGANMTVTNLFLNSGANFSTTSSSYSLTAGYIDIASLNFLYHQPVLLTQEHRQLLFLEMIL